MTFKQIYLAVKAKPTPCQDFIREVAAVTRKAESTVRTWLCDTEPDELTKKVLSDHFKVPVDELFRKEE